MWIGVLWAGLRVAMWITHVGGKFRHGLLEKSLSNIKISGHTVMISSPRTTRWQFENSPPPFKIIQLQWPQRGFQATQKIGHVLNKGKAKRG